MKKINVLAMVVALMVLSLTVTAFAEEIEVDNSVEEVESFEEIEAVVGAEAVETVGATQTGIGNFTDEYDNLRLEGIDGEAKLYIDGDSTGIILMRRLVAAEGFIDTNTKTVYLKRADGKWFWYNYIYQGTTDYTIQEAPVANGSVITLTEDEIKTALGIEDQNQNDENQNDENQNDGNQDTGNQDGDNQDTGNQDGDNQDTGNQEPGNQNSDDQNGNQNNENRDCGQQEGQDSNVVDTTYEIIEVSAKYDKVYVTVSINGYPRQFVLNVGENGRLADVAYDSYGTVWMTYSSNELQAWNAKIDPAEDAFIPVAVDCTGLIKDTDGKAIKYWSTQSLDPIALPTFEELSAKYFAKSEVYVAKEKNEYGQYDYTFIDERGMRTDKVISFISTKKFVYDGQRINAKKIKVISFNKEGEVLAFKGKKVLRLVKNSKGKYKFKAFQKKVAELHLDENTRIADYMVLKNDDKIDCVTKEPMKSNK